MIWLVLLDIARVLLAVAGVALAAWQVQLAVSNAGAGWRAHAGVAVALLITCGSRVENLGRPVVTWQFVGTVVFVALIGWSAYRRWRTENNSDEQAPA